MKTIHRAALALAFISLCACSTSGSGGSGGNSGTDYQPQVYAIGESYAALLTGVIALGVPIPSKVCGPIKAVSTLYVAAEKVSIIGTGNVAADVEDLETALVAAVTAAAEVGFSLAKHQTTALSADPTQVQWAALNASISSGTSALNCV